ncbi:MAG: protein kinase [Proteobacteria bacterium]|nr:protein kinase [Pseudomonadota bacterium]MCP4920883.1 protein kinase [Pseudomonadota bacterium]
MPRYIRNYEILSELGSGHFGTVYVAVGEVPGRGLNAGKRRLVAVKKLKDTSDANREALVTEFAMLDEVKHRGIVRVYEYLPEEDSVVMEYVHGITLRQVLDECNKAREQVFTEAAVEMVCELSDALYQAYTSPSDNGEPLNLVHRDLKPENIMLTRTGEVKILDFGLALVDNDEYARESGDRIKGTPIYMAPEQASGGEVDHRSDLFALGLIAYELFLNRAAYRLPENSHDPLGEIFDAIERGALHEQIGELESKLPGVGPIIAKLLATNPASRYRNGQDLLVDLRQQLYRDRGSYLAEFAEFFFGSIYDLPDPPSLDGAVGRAPHSSGNARKKRMSMEERLRASMARDAKVRKEQEKPGTFRGQDKRRPAAAKPQRSARPDRPGRKPDDNPQKAWDPVATREPRVRQVGARSPDETGMLEMISLQDEDDETEVEGDPSATAFFAIPAPKETRAKPPPLVTGQTMEGSPSPLGPPGGIARGPIAQGPVAPASGGIQGPVAGQPQKGPVATYSSGQAATPFQVGGGPAQPPPADAGQRTQSNRVFAILLAMMALVGVSVFAAVWLRPWENNGSEVAEVAAETTSGSSSSSSSSGSSSKDALAQADSAEPEVATPEPKKTYTRPKSSGSGSSGSGSTSSGGAGASAPKVAAGTLSVTLVGSSATTMEVTCPSGYRKRASVTGGKASLSDVPSESCTVLFKGAGAPVKYSPVGGGMRKTCTVTGVTANCK